MTNQGIDYTKEALSDLRSRSGYGCVLCGHPICQVVDTTKIIRLNNESLLDNLTILCQEHFLQWTTGSLKAKKLQPAIAKPINLAITKETYKPFFIDPLEKIDIKVGRFRLEWNKGSLANQSKCPIIVDQEVVFGINILEGQLQFSVCMFDEYNNNLLIVKDNIIQYCKETVRVLYLKDMLTVLKGNEIILSLHYQHPNKVVLKEARFFINGVQINIKDNKVFVNDTELLVSGKRNEPCLSIISIGQRSVNLNCQVYIPELNRFNLPGLE